MQVAVDSVTSISSETRNYLLYETFLYYNPLFLLVSKFNDTKPIYLFNGCRTYKLHLHWTFGCAGIDTMVVGDKFVGVFHDQG